MQLDFHYYATYCAAFLAGYSHEEALQTAYSAQFADNCTRTFLASIKAPGAAATTQLTMEMADARMNKAGIADITRIWASFHFLPGNLYAAVKGSRIYRAKYRLICNPNSDLLVETVKLAKGGSLQAAGIAMHVLADTWAHRYFAGTPSLVINNTNGYFYELLPDGTERPVVFRHSPGGTDDPESSTYNNSIYQGRENTIMNLGHGRAGHLPDYSFIRYKYLPAWGGYEEIIKNNPDDYLHAFGQMVYALKYLRGAEPDFEKNRYDTQSVAPWVDEICAVIAKRQTDASADWRALGGKISGRELETFDLQKYESEYLALARDKRDDSFLGRFILAAMAQKSMVTNKIFKSGNLLAGFSVDYAEKGFQGIRDFVKLIENAVKEERGND